MAIKSQNKPRTDQQEVYWSFWKEFNLYTKGDATFCREFKVHPYPSVRSYQDYHIGEPFHIVAGINFDVPDSKFLSCIFITFISANIKPFILKFFPGLRIFCTYFCIHFFITALQQTYC